jgi:hypothetical protein
VAMAAEVGTVAAAATVAEATVVVALILAAVVTAAAHISAVVVGAASTVAGHTSPEAAGIPPAGQPSRIQAVAGRRPSRVRLAAAVSVAIAPVRTITLQETEQARTAARQISERMRFIMRSLRVPWPAPFITTTP